MAACLAGTLLLAPTRLASVPPVRLRAVTLDFGGTLGGREHWRERFWRLYVRAGPVVERAAFDRAFAEATRAAYAEPGLREAGLERLVRYHLCRQLETLRVPWSARAERIAEEFAASMRRWLHEHQDLLSPVGEHACG